MKLVILVLFIFSIVDTFPTFSSSELVKVYTKVSKFKQLISIDFLNNKDDLVMIKVSLEQIFTNSLDRNRISILFQLINWITQYFDRLGKSNTQNTPSDEPIKEFKIYEELSKATLEYFDNRQRRDGEFMDSIGENGGYIEKSKIVGCSDPAAYRKNRVSCLKKYLKLVKKPTTEYVGIDLIDPLISFLNKRVPILNAKDIEDFAAIFGFTLRSPNKMEELLNKVIALKTKIPTPLYMELYEIQNNINPISENPSTVNERGVPSSETTNQNLPDTSHTNQGSTYIGSDTQGSTTSTNNLENLQTEDDRFGFLLTEIQENEKDIRTLTANFRNLENAAAKESLLLLENKLLALSHKIESKLSNDNYNEEDFSTKLLLLTRKLDELDITGSTQGNEQLKSKLEELEKNLTLMLEKNQLKNTEQNENLIMLKNDVDNIKLALSNSITMFNDERNKLQTFLAPLHKLSNDVENMRLKLTVLERENSNGIPTENNSQNVHELVKLALLVDTINKLIMECENIKLLLNKPKESKFLPDILKYAQIKYVYFSTLNPNIFVIDWDYYDEITEQFMITPLPICTMNQCHIYTNTGFGFGNDSKVFDQTKCLKIIQNEYFCKNEKETMNCPEYLKSCDIVKTVNFQLPKMVNETHLYLFTSGQTTIMSIDLPIYANILISFNKDTTFVVNNIEFFAAEFDQEEQIKITHLKLEDTLWSVEIYYTLVGLLGFGLSTLIITIVTVIVVKFKKRKQRKLVRVNRSRVYFDPNVDETVFL